MSFKNPLTASMAVIFLTITNNVAAVLIESDLSASGDGLLTRDTDTNLEWLDLTATLNLSLNDIATGASEFIPELGFRFATEGEVDTLTDSAGVVVSACDEFAGGDKALCIPSITSLLDLLGCTQGCDGTQPSARGKLFAEGIEVFWGIDTVNTTGFISSDSGAGPNQSDSTTGSFLVRAFVDIPEPSTYLLIFIGLTFITSGLRRLQE